MLLRLLRFGLVGSACFLIQLGLLFAMERWTDPILANWVSFIVSAQINFVLSYCWTWGDSPRRIRLGLLQTWAQFNAVVFAGSLINTAVFGLCFRGLSWPQIIAAISAIIVSTTNTFLFNHLIVFRVHRAGAEIRYESKQ